MCVFSKILRYFFDCKLLFQERTLETEEGTRKELEKLRRSFDALGVIEDAIFD